MGVIAVCGVSCFDSSDSLPDGVLGVSNGDMAWGDYDADGDFDLVVSGIATVGNTWETMTRIYRNDAGTLVDAVHLEAAYECAVAWCDYDGDGDLDLAIAGVSAAEGESYGRFHLLRNDGGVFTSVSNRVDQRHPASCAMAWADYDNDGDLDLAISGNLSNSEGCLLYRNDGGDLAEAADLAGGSNGFAEWADYDNDGDHDLLVAWRVVDDTNTILYGNSGGVFSEVGVDICDTSHGAVAWGDYDGDGYLDFFISGYDADMTPVSKLYHNESGTGFQDKAISAPGMERGDAAWGDYDGDGDLDLAASGGDLMATRMGWIYVNDSGVLTDSGVEFPRLHGSSLAWADIDGDGDLDLAYTGWEAFDYPTTTDGRTVLFLHENPHDHAHSPPSVPAGSAVSITGSDVAFSWDSSSDTETPAPGLTYNLRVGTAPGGNDVMPGMSMVGGALDGRRLVPAMGNVQHNTSWTLHLESGRTYYWSVQAVDTSFEGSTWAPEQMATVP